MWAFIFCVIFLVYLISRSSKQTRLFPPGPKPLPLIGNMLSVILALRKKKCYHKVWQSWARHYGQLLGLRLGIMNVVIVSGKDHIKEVSTREVFEGRPGGFFYIMRSFGKKIGLVFADGAKWTTTRRFVLKYLKNFGYNTRLMEKNIEEECRALVKLIMEDERRPVPVNSMFHVPVVNIMWRLVAGKRYELDDDRLKQLCDLVTRLFKAADMSGGILNFMPFLRHIMPDLIGYTELQSLQNQIYEFIEETIKEHEQNIDVTQPKDIIDAFLIEMSGHRDQPFTKQELYVVCLDLLEAGMETVSNTAVFMLLHLLRDQEVQRKLQKEIDEVVGNDRTPTVNHRTSQVLRKFDPIAFFGEGPDLKWYFSGDDADIHIKINEPSLRSGLSSMVYTEAVVLETLRISSVAAVGIPHMALDDARLGNYIIPKGTYIFLAMHDLHNGDHWKDPNVFRPERFLTKDGNLILDEWLMPFGAGKRRCIGEGLARSELFMFLTHLLQRFNLRIPEGDPVPSTEPIDGLSLSAKPFKAIFEPRF